MATSITLIAAPMAQAAGSSCSAWKEDIDARFRPDESRAHATCQPLQKNSRFRAVLAGKAVPDLKSEWKYQKGTVGTGTAPTIFAVGAKNELAGN